MDEKLLATTTKMVFRVGVILMAVIVLASGELSFLHTSHLSCVVDGWTLSGGGLYVLATVVSVIALGVDAAH